MTHDPSRDSSVGVVVQYLEKAGNGYDFFYMKKNHTGEKKGFGKKLEDFFSFFIIKSYHLATSSYVLEDNIFLPMAFIRFSKKVKVIQLWHGTGTIKKFGQSVNRGILGWLEKKANQTITHLIVNSEYTKKLYQQAFGIEEKKVYAFGIPRTDIFFDEEKKQTDINHFYHEFPELKDKKLILYAPTFRDQETKEPSMMLDVHTFLKETEEDFVLLLRLHPFVGENFSKQWKEEKGHGRVYNMSSYSDLNTLLFAAHMLITDYSSIIFEYCLLERPMIFYAYDLPQFKQSGRGFYEEYETYVPGPVVYHTEQIIFYLTNEFMDPERVKRFKREHFKYLDGKSTVRLCKKLFSVR